MRIRKPATRSMDWTNAVDRTISHSLKTRLGIPILYGVDAVHGHNNVLGAVIFPHNIGLGCTRDAPLVEEIGRVTALEVRATGIQWTFAPCIAVPRDDRWGRTYEGFSEDPNLVTILGSAAVKGLQNGRTVRSPRRSRLRQAFRRRRRHDLRLGQAARRFGRHRSGQHQDRQGACSSGFTCPAI